MNLDAYLRRIGWQGEPRADLATLQAIAAHHAAAIPFENLNPLLGLPVLLAPEAVERKLVDERRGGYCFEQNLLLWIALRAIGFEASGLLARVLWNQPDDAITPRSHMLLRVELDGGSHLVDVGFGGTTLTGALRLVPDIEQPTPHEPCRLKRAGDEWLMQTRIDGEWTTQYRFDLQRQHPLDYEAPNHFTATHPSSHFTQGLIAARSLPGRRLALRNRELAIHHTGGPSERRRLADATAIADTLIEQFGIALPDHPRLLQRLAALPA